MESASVPNSLTSSEPVMHMHSHPSPSHVTLHKYLKARFISLAHPAKFMQQVVTLTVTTHDLVFQLPPCLYYCSCEIERLPHLHKFPSDFIVESIGNVLQVQLEAKASCLLQIFSFMQGNA